MAAKERSSARAENAPRGGGGRWEEPGLRGGTEAGGEPELPSRRFSRTPGCERKRQRRQRAAPSPRRGRAAEGRAEDEREREQLGKKSA